MVRLSVIVPARDAAATLPRALAALAAQATDVAFQVVVVDDGSTDATAELARAAGLGPVVATAGIGPGGARNAGAAAADGELLAFIDADCFAEPGWVAAGLAAIADADLVQGTVAPDPSAAPGPFDRTLHVAGHGGLFESANLFVRRPLFEQLGGFQDWLGPEAGKRLGEDALFGWQAVRAGARTAFTEMAVVNHAVEPRKAAEFVAERLRLRFFPVLFARIPELRDHRAFAHVFLSRRSAAFDLAVLAGVAAAATDSPLAALGAAPYAAALVHQAAPWGLRLVGRVALVHMAADAAGLVALLIGSFRARALLL